MGEVHSFVVLINDYLSDHVLLILLVAIGLYYTIRTRFVQVRCMGQAFRQVIGNFSLHGRRHEAGLSSFQALATALAAQVGTGNIIGASGAILTGGPGAIFWMWIIAFFGMATIYGEAVLAQTTRITDSDGQIHGGPVYYITTAFPGVLGKMLAGFFSVATIIALGFTGCMVQSNSIAQTCANALGVPTWITGCVVTLLASIVFFGHTSRIGRVTEKLVPVMAMLYLLGGLWVIVEHIQILPESFAMIFRYAFHPEAIIGGTFGAAIKTAMIQGAKRGLFSNEAGMGSTPHAHAVAHVQHPHQQGVAAMFGVLIDTFVVLTLTAVVVITVLYSEGGPLAAGQVADGINRTNMAQIAFASVMGNGGGGLFVAVCLFFFAFSTILSWNFFGKINAHWLFGSKGVPVYCVGSALFVFAGSLVSNDFVWDVSDMFNQLMVLPNVLALFALAGITARLARKDHTQAAE